MLNNIQTSSGTIRGALGRFGKCMVFKGIPYAKPPVGDLRFCPPQEPDPWTGVLDCTEFKPAPVQPMVQAEKYETGEDCLYLNIYTPAESTADELPVMFWIYGGGFTFGASQEQTYDGSALSEKGCILVTINYRVNIFGFFNTEETMEKNGGPKCCGILDQIAALTWVRKNIREFGGDPENITIFGQSAGGMSVRMLLTSPLAKGMFSKAIVHSGGGLCEGDIVRPYEEFTKMCEGTLKHVGWTYDDIMKAPAEEVLERMLAGVREYMNDGDLQYFQPFLDGYALEEVPGVVIHKGEYQKVPVICTTVAGDSWMFSRKVKTQLEGNQNYFKGFAMCPGICWGRRNIETGREPIFSGYFDRNQPPKDIPYFTHGKPPFGVDTPHGSELAYVFGTLDLKDDRFTKYDYELGEVMRSYWTNFAKTGDPNGENLPIWPRFADDCEVSMHFGDSKIEAENLVENEEQERVMKFQVTHPGMLCSLEGF